MITTGIVKFLGETTETTEAITFAIDALVIAFFTVYGIILLIMTIAMIIFCSWLLICVLSELIAKFQNPKGQLTGNDVRIAKDDY